MFFLNIFNIKDPDHIYDSKAQIGLENKMVKKIKIIKIIKI